MVTIEGKALGRRAPLFADWSIPFPPDLHGDGDGLALRDLLARVVRAEVEAFRQRQADRRLLHVLTAREIETGVAAGKVDMGGRDVRQPVDAEAAVAVALEAFEDGLYLVVVDGQDQKSLDQPVFLRPDSRVTFVRLTMLAGG